MGGFKNTVLVSTLVSLLTTCIPQQSVKITSSMNDVEKPKKVKYTQELSASNKTWIEQIEEEIAKDEFKRNFYDKHEYQYKIGSKIKIDTTYSQSKYSEPLRTKIDFWKTAFQLEKNKTLVFNRTTLEILDTIPTPDQDRDSTDWKTLDSLHLVHTGKKMPKKKKNRAFGIIYGRKEKTQRSIERGGELYELNLEYFSRKGIPYSLIAKPIIESEYKYEANSWANAKGVWQFLAETARKNGLKVNSEIDERKSSILVLEAYKNFEEKRSEIYGDRYLALITTYNTGEGTKYYKNLRKEIKRTNNLKAFNLNIGDDNNITYYSIIDSLVTNKIVYDLKEEIYNDMKDSLESRFGCSLDSIDEKLIDINYVNSNKLNEYFIKKYKLNSDTLKVSKLNVDKHLTNLEVDLTNKMGFAPANYAVSFIAALELLREPHKYFPDIKIPKPKHYYCELEKDMHPLEVMFDLGLDEDEFIKVNPQFTHNFLKGNNVLKKGYPIRWKYD